MKNFVFYITIFSVFTEALMITIRFDIKFFYLVVFLNLLIFVLSKKIVYSMGLLFFHLLILGLGLYSSFFGYNDFGYFLIQFFFLLIIPIFYYSYFNFFQNRIREIVFLYCKVCLILAIIGFLKLPYDMSFGRSLNSLLLEPAHYCTIVLPAFFITLKEKSFPRYYFIIILLSIIISGSSLGILGLGFSIVLLAKRISLIKIFVSFLSIMMIGYLVYVSFSPFRMRLDDTINSMIDKDLSKANLSTYALLSNFYVANQSFLSNPLLGNGMGSHVNSRIRYLNEIEGIQVFEEMGLETLNDRDAGSLFTRVLSELGIVGILGIFYFIIRFYVPSKNGEITFQAITSRAILLYFFSKLLREGHYFSPEMYFFVFLFVFIKIDSSKYKPFNCEEK